MVSNFRFKIAFFKFISGIFFLSLFSCGNYSLNRDKDGEKIIGKPLNSLGEMTPGDGVENSKISIFDNTTRKIHVFNIDAMTHLRSLEVQNPEAEHFILGNDTGKYILDFSKKRVVIHTDQNSSNSIFKFAGTPISAAYSSPLNLLVMYDDMSNVGIAEFNNEGELQGLPITLGPLLSEDKEDTILAGDILKDGRLVLAMKSNQIFLVDTKSTLSTKKWVTTHFDSTLTEIVWVASVADNPEQIFVKSSGKLALIDLTEKKVINSLDIKDFSVEKYSKSQDAHILLRSLISNELSVFFPQTGTIKSRLLIKQDKFIMASYLNLAKDTWVYVERPTDTEFHYLFNSVDSKKKSRSLKQYRLSDLGALQNLTIRDDAQVRINESYVFSLMPSELGYAIRTGLDLEEEKELKLFNMKHIK